jgi:hypothetical protein
MVYLPATDSFLLALEDVNSRQSKNLSLLEELQTRNPRDDKGRRGHKHHHWLTEDVGHPALAQHLHAVIGLMRASSNWGGFHELLDRAFPKKGSVLQLELISE